MELKRKKTVQITILCFTTALQVLLIWKTRGEVTDSLVAVVIVYYRFKGVGYQNPTLFQQSNNETWLCNAYVFSGFLCKNNDLISTRSTVKLCYHLFLF